MQSKFTILLISLFLFTGKASNAQTDTNSTHISKNSSLTVTKDNSTAVPDDDFDLFLLVFATIVISVMIGFAMVGALSAIGLLLLLAAFISFGVLSVSVLAGLYKRSVTTSFKTFVHIACPLAGAISGILGFWIIINLFKVSILNQSGLLAGAIGGFLGGLLLAFVFTKITLILAKYLLRKLS